MTFENLQSIFMYIIPSAKHVKCVIILSQFYIFTFLNLWLCCIFIAACNFSLVAMYRGFSGCGVWASHCRGFSCGTWALGARVSVVAACGLTGFRLWALEGRLSSSVCGLSCFKVSGIFPDQRSNLCTLHWKADSQPLNHQGRSHLSFRDESIAVQRS